MTYAYAHMCQMDHERIGHNDSEHEACPLCRANYRAEMLQEALRQIASFDTTNHGRWPTVVAAMRRIAAEALG